jgi:hypothetical protein
MNVVDWISIAAAFAVTGWFTKVVTDKRRDDERYGEDDARTFFDEHGRWPEEDPDEVEAQRRRAAEAERVARASYRGG